MGLLLRETCLVVPRWAPTAMVGKDEVYRCASALKLFEVTLAAGVAARQVCRTGKDSRPGAPERHRSQRRGIRPCEPQGTVTDEFRPRDLRAGWRASDQLEWIDVSAAARRSSWQVAHG